MLSLRRHSRAAALVSVLMALLIMGILSAMMLNTLNTGSTGGRGFAPAGSTFQTQRARESVSAANKRAAETTLVMEMMGRSVSSLDWRQLRDLSKKFPNDPTGGQYYVVDQQVYNTRGIETPKFSERFRLDRL